MALPSGTAGFRELSLFAGAGGGILGGKLLGWRCVCAVEIESYCREVLLRRQRDGLLPLFPIWDDVQTFDGRPWRGRVDVLTGGFPCQPFSTAGKQAGADDKRNMWPDTLRVLREVEPRIALLENVPGLLYFDYFGEILGGLAEAGYDAEWAVVSAAECGAPHFRERLWILAYPQQSRGSGGEVPERNQPAASGGRQADSSGSGGPPEPALSDAGRIRRYSGGAEQSLQGLRQQGQARKKTGKDRHTNSEPTAADRQVDRGSDAESGGDAWSRCWSAQSGLGGASDGLAAWLDGTWEYGTPRVTEYCPDRVQRLKAIGNGQVPQTLQKAFLILVQRAGLLQPLRSGGFRWIG